VLSVITESEGAIPEGTPLVTIGDPRRIEVVVDLLSREAVRVKPGDRVRIEQWGGPQPLTGRVQRIEPFGRLKISALGIEEQRVNVIIAFDDASRAAAARLGHGYQIDATIIVWQRPDVLRVPIGALLRGQNGAWAAYVVEQGRAVRRGLEIGQINDQWGEVRSGLNAGERVVVNPTPGLTDGARVQAR
jgi:HlyD family secretion protein